jgi:hypothetical protein
VYTETEPSLTDLTRSHRAAAPAAAKAAAAAAYRAAAVTCQRHHRQAAAVPRTANDQLKLVDLSAGAAVAAAAMSLVGLLSSIARTRQVPKRGWKVRSHLARIFVK